MRSSPALLCSTAFFVATFTGVASASPGSSRLIPLIPAGAEIVAGVEQPHTATPHHPLLLITNNNRLDLDDWLAITGVDSRRAIEEVIWVAASSQESELGERLLLIDGRFDRKRILESARRNGGASVSESGVDAVAIATLPRDGKMHETRWLAFPDDHTAIFGTPRLVRQAIDRNAAHASPDATLVARLALLRADVTSWSMVAMSPSMAQMHVAPAQASAPWLRVLALAGELTLGVHDSSSPRVDLAADAGSQERAQVIANLLHEAESNALGLGKPLAPRLASFSMNQTLVEASLVIPGDKFNDYVS